MRNLVLIFIALTSLYIMISNNVVKLPGQLIWSTNPDIFYKIFIPLLMLFGAIVSLIEKDRNNIFLLTGGALLTDAIHRLSVAVYHLYFYIRFGDIPIPPPKEGVIRVVLNYWPSHVVLIIEIALLFFCASFFINLKSNSQQTHNIGVQGTAEKTHRP